MNTNFDNYIPILSKGIEFNRLTDDEFILSNSKHKHYLKINKEVYNLLKIIDGFKNLTELTVLYKNKHNIEISTDIIRNILINQLSKYGILKGFEDSIKKYEKPSYLNLSFIIINEKILSKIVKYFHFLFYKKIALILIFSLTLFIITVLILNFNLYQTFNLQNSLLYFVVIMAFSVTFHEIGHATSASFFGAKHGGIGGGFYLFTPVYFADVTDIWRLSKTKRILINLSGMYFELIFCSILVFISLMINNFLLLTLSLIVCIKTIFNLIPFLRSDGYWILSDLTNKPNLFYHSFEKIKDIFRFIFQKKKLKWSFTDFILFIYGFVSFSFISLFLYYVMFKNPSSLLNFPENIYNFVINLFEQNTEFSIVKYGELIIPLIFIYLVFNLMKSFAEKIKLKWNNIMNKSI